MIDEKLLSPLRDNGLVEKIISVEETTSTNDMAKKCARDGYKGTALFISELQTAGRGRLGRSWSSPSGTGIWMSYLVSGISGGLEHISVNTLLAGLAVSESLNEYASETGAEISCLIKWPNDIVVGGRKICGILSEFITEGADGSLIIGIGINTGQQSFPEELADKGTSYYMETGAMPSREVIICKIIEKLARLREKGFAESGTLERYCELMVSLDKEVVLTSANGDFPDNPYIARGITEEGDLVVEDKYGRRSKVTSGEVSVRGVLGYI